MSNSTILNAGSWRIQLFGSLEIVTANGKSLTVSGKKTGELLAYLALHQSRNHSREKLIDLIWGDSEVGDARTRLRQEILKLRTLIDSAANDSTPLLITKDTCRIRAGTFVDTLQFDAACHEASRENDYRRKCNLYQTAIRLYTSELLPGYEATWIVGERVRLNQSWSRALLELADAQRQLRDFAGAAESLATLQENDPQSEECYIAQMRLYADMGQPTRVQQQFLAMEKALRDRLGVSPTAASLKLAEDLREEAGKRATETANLAADPFDDQAAPNESAVLTNELQTSTQLSQPPPPAALVYPSKLQNNGGKAVRWLAVILLAAVVTAMVLLHLRATHAADARGAPAHVIIERNKE